VASLITRKRKRHPDLDERFSLHPPMTAWRNRSSPLAQPGWQQGGALSTYRIVCVTTQHPHRHIISVGVGGNDRNPSRRLTIAEVRRMIDSGDTFYTQSPTTERRARVHKDTCKEPFCMVATIRSSADAIRDNNLDYLPGCP